MNGYYHVTAAREPARLTAFSVAFDGQLTEFSNIDLTSTNDGDPQHVEFCRPTNPANTPRLAISYNAPTNPGDFGRVRLYNALSQANPTLEELQDFTGESMGQYTVTYTG